MPSWRPPRPGTLKCNVDASWDPHKHFAAIGIIIRDSSGLIQAGLAKRVPAQNPQTAEALAIREGVLLAHNLQQRKCIFESDNLKVISACREEEKVGEIAIIIQDILTMKPSFELCGFTWTPREGNEAANFLARAAIRGSLSADWVLNPHPPLSRILQKEAQACSS
ncbi:Ribonuclease H-like superfamily [Sesbania bispinosa]|nr:Ribonuclease H-like superfamily [Sesbania bispinosa]